MRKSRPKRKGVFIARDPKQKHRWKGWRTSGPNGPVRVRASNAEGWQRD